MAYSDFTLREVIDRFGLTLTDVPDLFGDAPEVEPGPLLRACCRSSSRSPWPSIPRRPVPSW